MKKIEINTNKTTVVGNPFVVAIFWWAWKRIKKIVLINNEGDFYEIVNENKESGKEGE
ncbi:hypothetical protein LCGC14_2364860 [marine sediment metagenome]|uniref:Uncharacterized protein n=1 Tax=marine sediment metagenome TaxID=412755 RepID=A0A0F9CST6_9ZZZZ